MNSGLTLVCVLWVSVNCRSIGEPVGVNCPDQANYQDYGEQQEYVERQVRDVEDRPGKYGQKDYARDSRVNSNIGAKNVPEAAYRSRDNGDDEDQEVAPAEQVVVDRRELEERDEKKEEDSVDAEVANQRNDEGLRQGNSDISGADAVYRQPRENVEGDPQEAVRMTESARSQGAEAGYDAINEQQAEPAKDDPAYAAGDYSNYDYAPEQEPQERAEGQQNVELTLNSERNQRYHIGPHGIPLIPEQNVAPGNEEAAGQSQYEREN